MPILEFICDQCGDEQELIQKITDPTPICKCGNEMRRKISLCSFRLEGTGWYATDYQKPSNTTSAPEKKDQIPSDIG